MYRETHWLLSLVSSSIFLSYREFLLPSRPGTRISRGPLNRSPSSATSRREPGSLVIQGRGHRESESACSLSRDAPITRSDAILPGRNLIRASRNDNSEDSGNGDSPGGKGDRRDRFSIRELSMKRGRRAEIRKRYRRPGKNGESRAKSMDSRGLKYIFRSRRARNTARGLGAFIYRGRKRSRGRGGGR